MVGMGVANGKGKGKGEEGSMGVGRGVVEGEEGDEGGVDSDDGKDILSLLSTLSTLPPPSLVMRGVWGWVIVAWMWDASHTHALLLTRWGGWLEVARARAAWACRLCPPTPHTQGGPHGGGACPPPRPHTPSSHVGRGQRGGMGVDAPHPQRGWHGGGHAPPTKKVAWGWGASMYPTPMPPGCFRWGGGWPGLII